MKILFIHVCTSGMLSPCFLQGVSHANIRDLVLGYLIMMSRSYIVFHPWIPRQWGPSLGVFWMITDEQYTAYIMIDYVMLLHFSRKILLLLLFWPLGRYPGWPLGRVHWSKWLFTPAFSSWLFKHTFFSNWEEMGLKWFKSSLASGFVTINRIEDGNKCVAVSERQNWRNLER